MPSEEDLKQVAFNISLQLITHIAELLRKADEFFSAGNYTDCFSVLHTLRLNINQDLNADERTKFDNLEKGFKLYEIVNRLEINKDQWYSAIGNSESESIEYLIEKFHKTGNPKSKVIEYRIELQDVLEKYKYLIKKAEDLKHMF